jgi:hypothetical protein
MLSVETESQISRSMINLPGISNASGWYSQGEKASVSCSSQRTHEINKREIIGGKSGTATAEL